MEISSLLIILENLVKDKEQQIKQLFEFQSYESNNSKHFDDEDDEEEDESMDEENDDEIEIEENDHENEENNEQLGTVHNTEEEEEVNEEKEEKEEEEEEEEKKINQPERESKEDLKEYMIKSQDPNGNKISKECIFETGNMAKDSNIFLNEDYNENHFISLDSICEKSENMSKKEESLLKLEYIFNLFLKINSK